MTVYEYNYEPRTGAYIGRTQAVIDPEETALQEKLVYAPAKYGTFIAPPEFSVNQIPIFNKESNSWSIVDNYYGKYQVNLETQEISKIDYIGAVKSGFQYISDEVSEDYYKNPSKYAVINNKFLDISTAVDSFDEQEVVGAKTKYKQAEILARYNALADFNTSKYNLAMNTKIELNGKFLKPMFIQKWTTVYTDALDDISMGIDSPKCNYSWYETSEESSYKLFENIDFNTVFLVDFRAIKPIAKYIETKYQKYLDFILSMYNEIENFQIENYQSILMKLEEISNMIDYEYNGGVVTAEREA